MSQPIRSQGGHLVLSSFVEFRSVVSEKLKMWKVNDGWTTDGRTDGRTTDNAWSFGSGALKTKMVTLDSYWMIHCYFSSATSNGIQRNLKGSKTSTSSAKSVFYGPIGKPRLLPWPLIRWKIFDILSGTAERNLSKPAGRKIPTTSNKFVFWGESENQDGRPGLWFTETFSLHFWNSWSELNLPW